MKVRYLLGLLLCACGASQSPGAPAPAKDPAPGATTSEPVASSAEPARQRKPFPIHNACTEVVTLVFGDDPKAANADRRKLDAHGDFDGPRDSAGNQTVWLLDDKGEPLVKVNVTRGMKRVEVGRSCRTLDAR